MLQGESVKSSFFTLLEKLLWFKRARNGRTRKEDRYLLVCLYALTPVRMRGEDSDSKKKRETILNSDKATFS